jgi:hypothetical protein
LEILKKSSKFSVAATFKNIEALDASVADETANPDQLGNVDYGQITTSIIEL